MLQLAQAANEAAQGNIPSWAAGLVAVIAAATPLVLAILQFRARREAERERDVLSRAVHRGGASVRKLAGEEADLAGVPRERLRDTKRRTAQEVRTRAVNGTGTNGAALLLAFVLGPLLLSQVACTNPHLADYGRTQAAIYWQFLDRPETQAQVTTGEVAASAAAAFEASAYAAGGPFPSSRALEVLQLPPTEEAVQAYLEGQAEKAGAP